MRAGWMWILPDAVLPLHRQPIKGEWCPAATPSITPSSRHCRDKLRRKAARFLHGAAPAAFLMTDGSSEDCKIRETCQDPGGGVKRVQRGRRHVPTVAQVQVKSNTENKSRGDSLNCSNSWMKFNMTPWGGKKKLLWLKNTQSTCTKAGQVYFIFLFHK